MLSATAVYRSRTHLREREPIFGLDLRRAATVDGEPVTVAELRAGMIVHRAEVAARFTGDPNAPGFWTRPSGGEPPIEALRKQALEHLTGIKVQQILARETGILSDIGYPRFLRQLREENLRRQQRVAGQEPIFGPQQYTEQTFFAYQFDRMVLDLKAALAQSRFALTEPQARAYYNRVKDIRFRASGSGYQAFDDVRPAVLASYVDEAYAGLVEELVLQSVVVRFDDVLNRVDLG